jgi:hypothetical protein
LPTISAGSDLVGNASLLPTLPITHWEWLHYLGKHQDKLWQEYLDQLEKAGKKRAPLSQ